MSSGVTDFHVHAFPDHLAQRTVGKIGSVLPGGAVLDGTVCGLLRSMDRAGIRRSVVCSIATAPKQADAILQWSLSIRSDRIVPFASVHPACDDPAGEIARIAEAGLRGVKCHAQFQGVAADSPDMWPIYRAAAECGLILVLHAGQDLSFPNDDQRADPERILAVHRAFPGVPLVAAHMGGWRRWEAVAETLAGTDVYLETSFSMDMVPPEVLRRILEAHSPDRILFGTDSPWRDQSADLEATRRVFPDAELQRKALGGNADRLLGEVVS